MAEESGQIFRVNVAYMMHIKAIVNLEVHTWSGSIHHSLKYATRLFAHALQGEKRTSQVLRAPISRAGHKEKWFFDAIPLSQQHLLGFCTARMKNASISRQVHGGNSVGSHVQYPLEIRCGAVGAGNEVRCAFSRCTVPYLDHLLLWPEINGKEKWDEVMNRNHYWTAQQRGRIKRTMKEIQLVAFFETPKFKRCK